MKNRREETKTRNGACDIISLSKTGIRTMAYMGHVENGAVVLDEPVALPDGAAMNIETSGDN